MITARAIHLLGWLLTPFIFFFWQFVTLMPERVSLIIASPFGTFIRQRTKLKTLENMKRVLGNVEWPEKRWEELWKSHAAHTAGMLFEMIRFDSLPLIDVQPQFTFEGEDHLVASLRKGRGAMLFLNHCGNMAVVVGGLAMRGYNIALAGNPIWIPYLERRIQHIHSRVGARRVHLGDRVPKTAADLFQKNGIFAMFIDFTVGKKHTSLLPFGSCSMWTSLAPAIIALREKVDVLCASSIRYPGNRHSITIHPPLEYNPSNAPEPDAIALMTKAMAFVEADVRDHPEQWWPWNYARLQPRQASIISPLMTPQEKC